MIEQKKMEKNRQSKITFIGKCHSIIKYVEIRISISDGKPNDVAMYVARVMD